MEHRITLASNPRIFILFALIGALPFVGIFLIVTVNVIVGLIALVLIGFLDYHLVRFAISQFRSIVRTTDDGIECKVYGEETIELEWDDVTHAGYVEQEKSRPFIFLYSAFNDKLLTIPNEYTDFEALTKEVESRCTFRRIELTVRDSIKDYLRRELGGEPGGS